MLLAGVPLWVFTLIMLIFLCGYMAFRAIRAERKMDQHFIEQEGNIYIQRMEKERKRRNQGNQSH